MEEIWSQTTDGGMLHQLFGQYPTMHDAEIRGIHFSQGKLEMVLDYAETLSGDPPLVARIRLEWTGVSQLDFPLGELSLLGLQLLEAGEGIEARLEMWPGVYATIVSESFEAILMQVDPGPNDEPPFARMRF